MGNPEVACRGGVDEVFRALADPTRRVLLEELRRRDGQTLFELCTRLISGHGVAPAGVAGRLDAMSAPAAPPAAASAVPPAPTEESP